MPSAPFASLRQRAKGRWEDHSSIRPHTVATAAWWLHLAIPLVNKAQLSFCAVIRPSWALKVEQCRLHSSGKQTNDRVERKIKPSDRSEKG